MFLATYIVVLRDTPRTTEVGHVTQAAIASFLLHVASDGKLVGSLDEIRQPLR